MTEADTEKLSFLCSWQLRQMLVAVASREERSKSAVIRRALDQYFERSGYYDVKEGEDG